MKPASTAWLLPAGALACLLAAQFMAEGKRLPYPGVSESRTFAGSGMRDAGFLAFGARRLGADTAFIELLQYYASHENHDEDPNAGFYVYGLAPKPEWKMEGGDYPEFMARAKRVLWLDPYFRFAVFYAAGALAFNQNRPQEALEILDIGRKWLPKEWKYDLLAAAITYSKGQESARQAAELDRVIEDPDAPDMLRQLTAFLNKKSGNYRRAYEIYGTLLDSSNAGYAANAAAQRKILKPLIDKAS
ncbi:MAG: hypothetical protein GX410_01060 [Elusimicrobia bacterium]|nr:hypothetical protein [Elusimicrobiota bacterium]